MPTTDDPPLALAAAVVNRRAELELTTVAVAERAGISRSTLHAIERGHRSNLLARTLAQLDRALEWQIGTCRALATNNEVTTAMAHDDDDDDVAAQIERIVAVVSRLTVGERERVIGYAEALRDAPKRRGFRRRATDRRGNGSD